MKKTIMTGAVLFALILNYSCSHKKNDVFPVIDFIKGQVAHVDTSVYSIMKIVPLTDSTNDTTYVKREEFKNLAKDFLETPDISKTYGGKYTEERMMNNDLGLVVYIATPTDEDLEVRRQEVRISPDPPNDQIKSVYLERIKTYPDSSVLKRLTWYTDRKFQVVTLIQKKNGTETNSVMNVVWNDQENN